MKELDLRRGESCMLEHYFSEAIFSPNALLLLLLFLSSEAGLEEMHGLAQSMLLLS